MFYLLSKLFALVRDVLFPPEPKLALAGGTRGASRARTKPSSPRRTQAMAASAAPGSRSSESVHAASPVPPPSMMARAILGDLPLPTGAIPVLPGRGLLPGANLRNGLAMGGVTGRAVRAICEANPQIDWVILTNDMQMPTIGGLAVLVRLDHLDWRIDVEAPPNPDGSPSYIGTLAGVVVERIRTTSMQVMDGYLACAFELEPWWVDVDPMLRRTVEDAAEAHIGFRPSTIDQLMQGVAFELQGETEMLAMGAEMALRTALDALQIGADAEAFTEETHRTDAVPSANAPRSQLAEALLPEDPTLPTEALPSIPVPGLLPGMFLDPGIELTGHRAAQMRAAIEDQDWIRWMVLHNSDEAPQVGDLGVLVLVRDRSWRLDVNAMPDPRDFDNAVYVARFSGLIVERVRITGVDPRPGYATVRFEVEPWWTGVDPELRSAVEYELERMAGWEDLSLGELNTAVARVLGRSDALLEQGVNAALAAARVRLAEKPPIEAEVDPAEAIRDAVKNGFGQAGTVRPEVLAPMINPAFSGGVRWPALRQAFRLVDCEDGVLMATDGLSDLDDDGESLGIELWAKSHQPGGNGPDWLYRMVKGMGDVCAMHPELPMMLDRMGLITVSMHPQMLGEHSEAFLDDGGITVMIGLNLPFVPLQVDTPVGPVRLASIIVLRPEEAAFARQSPDHTQVLGDKLLEHKPAWHNDLDRSSVV